MNELDKKIKELGIVSEDGMFLMYSQDGILDLANLYKQELKKMLVGLKHRMKYCEHCGGVIDEKHGSYDSLRCPKGDVSIKGWWDKVFWNKWFSEQNSKIDNLLKGLK